MMKYRILRTTDTHAERGVVSILSVIFFVILMSVLTVSFLRVVTDQQEQTIEDDLSKGALASAQSGVEDAKRALLHCRTTPGDPACAALDETACPGVFKSPAMIGALGLNANPDGSIKVGAPNNNDNQRYTCVTIARQTESYVGALPPSGLGEIIPLRSVSAFNQVQISWHQTDVDGAGAIPSSMPTNPRTTQWKNGSGVDYISMLRAQLIQFVPGQTLAAMSDQSSATFLVPTQFGSNKVVVGGGAQLSSNSMPKRQAVNCTSPAPESGYLCTTTIDMSSPTSSFTPLPGSEFYLLLRSQYNTTHFEVKLFNDGVPALFDDVQPVVDSTGAAANVYKRLISHVAYKKNDFPTTNAIESGIGICKDFFVTINSYNDSCAGILDDGTAAAGIGGYCSINLCLPTPGNVGPQPITWDRTLVNQSTTGGKHISGCKWDFGDGTAPYPGACQPGDNFVHPYPSDPAYNTNPNLPLKHYTTTLVVYFDDGSQTNIASYDIALPNNYP